MKKEIRDRWVAALRSGEYKQGIYHLQSRDHYCCLGVLCEIAVQEGAIQRQETRPDGAVVYGSGPFREAAFLPYPVVKWAGADDQSHNDTFWDLATLNDRGTPFEEIADVIEGRL